MDWSQGGGNEVNHEQDNDKQLEEMALLELANMKNEKLEFFVFYAKFSKKH